MWSSASPHDYSGGKFRRHRHVRLLTLRLLFPAPPKGGTQTWIIAMAYEDKSIAEVAVYEDESKPEPQLDGLTATSSELKLRVPQR